MFFSNHKFINKDLTFINFGIINFLVSSCNIINYILYCGFRQSLIFREEKHLLRSTSGGKIIIQDLTPKVPHV